MIAKGDAPLNPGGSLPGTIAAGDWPGAANARDLQILASRQDDTNETVFDEAGESAR
jgi:hypothetical protein